MIHLSQRFEFSASHRLHSAHQDEQWNRQTYGKCNNPHGHGHNYELEVTIAGECDERGVLMPVPELERLVEDQVIRRLDHRHLNVEIAEFRETVPSVENIARVIYGWLRQPLSARGVRLAGVTVWETPRTWCRYEE